MPSNVSNRSSRRVIVAGLDQDFRREPFGPMPELLTRAEFADKLQPILPHYRASFEMLERWVEQGSEPPESQSVPKPEGGHVVNTSQLLEDARHAGL